MSKSRLDKMYSYKYAGLRKEERKLLTKEDDKFHRCLLDSHILGSFISPRKVIADYAGKRVISSVMCSIWIGDRGDVLYKNPSNVMSRANKAWMFYIRDEGVVGFAEELYSSEETNGHTINVSILEKPVFFDDNRVLLSNNNRTTFAVKDKTKFEKIVQDFVKIGKIEEPKKEVKQENVNVNVIEENNTL